MVTMNIIYLFLQNNQILNNPNGMANKRSCHINTTAVLEITRAAVVLIRGI